MNTRSGRFVGAVVVSVVGWAPSAFGQTLASCGAASDSPLGAVTSCNSACALRAGNTALVCDLSACAGVVEATIVSNYSNGNEEVAWGSCNGTNFCCTLNDTGNVEEVWLIGGDSADTLAFHYGAYNLELNGADERKAVIRGGDNADAITGSDETDTKYLDCLYGEDHADYLLARAGADVSSGGQGNDTAHGQPGDDCMWGGNGYDAQYGGYGVDNLYDDCQGNGGSDYNFMQGGPDDDNLWYAWSGGCDADDVLDATSSCDSGSPAGTDDKFAQTSGYMSAPSDCENYPIEPTTPEACPLDCGEIPDDPPQE